MTNLERRLRRLEFCLTDVSGLTPHTEAWLKHWDREIFNYMQDPEHRRPKVLFSVQAVRAVMRWSDNPASLVGSIRDEDDDEEALRAS
jgi:hypothetical protein